MAQVLVTFSKAMGQGSTGGRYPMPILAPTSVLSEEMTSSGTAADSTIASREGDVCRIVNNGAGLIWVTFAADPTAAVATGYAVPAGGTLEVGPFPAGLKAGVIDDS